MTIRAVALLGTLVIAPGHIPPAAAGGLFLPGSGAISTSRAGAAITSTDDGEALSINPAGLAKTNGWTLTISAALIQYFMEFQRAGNYDTISDDDQPYEGQPYPTVTNDPSPPLGLGGMQPVPVVALVTDFGGRMQKLRLALGLYAPNAYPFRDMTNGYAFNGDFAQPPPPTRYDILKQEAAVILPSIAASYRITPNLDVGLRLSFGRADLKSTVAIWGSPGNVEEAVKHDGAITADASDGFVPAFGLGVLYRPTPQLEFGLAYNSWAAIHAKGEATSETGPAVAFSGIPATIGPVAPGTALCAEGGSFDAQKACVDLALPQSATLGARYKRLDDRGAMKADIELNLGWENWGSVCERNSSNVLVDPDCASPSEYRVTVDAAAYIDRDMNGTLDPTDIVQALKDSVIDHRLQDTYSIRLGGSYLFPIGAGDNPNRLTIRGGVGYDTAAAQKGWLRADIDGAARVTATLGAGYRTKRFEINFGGGAIFEGSPTNEGAGPGGALCNPADGMHGCGEGGVKRPIEDRQGPDPVNPIVTFDQQLENPVNQGTFTSSYLLLMLGVSTWF